jgi:hypothetical protein
VFIAPVGLWLTLDAGKVEHVAYNIKSGEIELTLTGGEVSSPQAYLQLEQNKKGFEYKVNGNFSIQRNRYVIPLSMKKTSLRLVKVN